MEPEQQAARGRPRRSETDDAIVRSAQELMRERGPGGVNVAAVSAHSGVARTTIYRRYADRQALLEAALQPITDRGAPAELMSVEDKLGWVLARTEEVLDQGIGRGGVAAVLTDQDPEFSAALRGALKAGLQSVREQIETDLAAGALVPGTDPEVLLDLVLGAYLAASLRHRELPEDWWEGAAALLSRALGVAG